MFEYEQTPILTCSWIQKDKIENEEIDFENGVKNIPIMAHIWYK